MTDLPPYLDPKKVWEFAAGFFTHNDRFPTMMDIMQRFGCGLPVAVMAADDIGYHVDALADSMEGMVAVGNGYPEGAVLEVWRTGQKIP